MGKRQSLQQMVVGKLDSNMQKNASGPLSYTIHKNKLNADIGPKCGLKNHENLRTEHRQ